MSKLLFQGIQFNISSQFSTIRHLYRTLLGSTTPSHSESGIDDNEGVVCILQSSSIIGALPSDCLVSYPENSLGESYLFVLKQSVYSTILADSVREYLMPDKWKLFVSSIVTWSYNYLLKTSISSYLKPYYSV